MNAVKSIVSHLEAKAATEVRALLERDHTYSEISLEIFDNYRNQNSLEQVMDAHKLDEKSLKIFERVIYLSILAYYELEDNSMKDVLCTTVFYALNGNCEKEKNERIKELEGYFHSMKRYEIEEEASPLLSELYQLNQGGQLETVYRHLYLKYKELDSLISTSLQLFENINEGIAQYLVTANYTYITDIIRDYKIMRRLSYSNSESKNLSCLMNLAKLNLVVITGQDQLLKESKESIEDLLFITKNQIDSLSFGLKRFYLQNIYAQVAALYNIQINELEEATKIMDKTTLKGMEVAYNFKFAKCIFKDIRNRVVEHKFQKRNQSVFNQNSIKSKFLEMQQSFKIAVSTDLLPRNPYSHLVN